MQRKIFIPYSIYQGKIFSDHFFFRPFLKKHRISYEVLFTESAHYCTSVTKKINDLFGFEFGLLKPTQAAFAWRPCNAGFEVFAYCKEGKQKITYSLAYLLPNQSYNFTIQKHKEYFSYSIFSDIGDLICYYKISRNKCFSFGKEIIYSFADICGAPSKLTILLKRKY